VPNELVPFERRLEEEKDNILARLPKLNDWLTPERWYTVVRDLTKRGEFAKVVRENPDSLIDALKNLAVWGLEPDGDEAFINVYNEKHLIEGKEVWLPTAQAQAMYKGMVRRAVEAGAIAHCVADVIRQGDTIEEVVSERGRHLKHTRAFNKGSNRKLIGAYALFWMPNGLMDYELFEEEDIERCKAASLRLQQRGGREGKLSPAWQYSPGEMAKKSVLRRGLKRMKGKRDSSYMKLMEAQSTFDIETSASEVPPGELSADERPRAATTEGQTAPSPHEARNPGEKGSDGAISGSETGADTAIDAEFAEVNGASPPQFEQRHCEEAWAACHKSPTEKAAAVKKVIPNWSGIAKLSADERRTFILALRGLLTQQETVAFDQAVGV
jgi:recombinational DNA repair protein RecT